MNKLTKVDDLIYTINPEEIYKLTIRDQFAMAALAGLLSGPEGGGSGPKGDADWSYSYADAMLEARKK